MKNKNIKNKTHTLIISDLHLGSDVSRSKDAADLLKSYQFKKLILLGDIFEDLNFNRLKENDWKFLSLIGKISKTKKVRWVEGNHDEGLAKIFGVLTGARVYKVYRWRHKNRKYAAIHGHQFDNFLIDNVFLSFLASKIYSLIQRMDFKDKNISHFVKKTSKGWLRLSDKVARRAITYARLRGINYIFCGHTHKAMEERRGKIRYYNSGCWTDMPPTYITLDEKRIEIHKYY
ncbi:MAG: UDP-2,3-diacylglucosamine diphosphatase [Candidatus Moranbacteria bacterium]|nr:UDP-2,3-diacylglucosamine diphosphatase [Candidatus Moranbacteria bacterium]